jgi:hypothetical protein
VSLRLAALALALAASLSAVDLAPAGADEATSDGTLTMISTPDDPFGGGRYLTPRLTFESNTAEALLLSFRRQDGAGAFLVDDPLWVVRVESPADLATNTSYTLTGSTDDVLQLANATEFQRTRCPSLTGSVSFEDVSTDENSLTTVMAATFTIHCTAEDTLSGSVGFNTSTPPLPGDTAALIDAEARFPTLVSVFDGETANMLAIDVRRRSLLLRWDTPGGFTCVDAQVEDAFDTPLATYSGRDDTMEVRQVDPTAFHRVTVALSDSEPCTTNSPIGWESIPIFPLVATLREPTLNRRADQMTLHGRLDSVTPGLTEPVPGFDLECRVRKPDGSVVTRGVVTTGTDGRFYATLPSRHAQHVWVAIEPGSEPTGPWAPEDTWYHFGDRSQHYSLP